MPSSQPCSQRNFYGCWPVPRARGKIRCGAVMGNACQALRVPSRAHDCCCCDRVTLIPLGMRVLCLHRSQTPFPVGGDRIASCSVDRISFQSSLSTITASLTFSSSRSMVARLAVHWGIACHERRKSKCGAYPVWPSSTESTISNPTSSASKLTCDVIQCYSKGQCVYTW